MTEASAPGKLILCGEHAVVYGRPAIALPLSGVRARAVVSDGPPGSGILCEAADLGRSWTLAEDPADPFSELIARLLADLAPPGLLDLRIVVSSSIPIAGGMGSGAAIATAIVRALAAHLGHGLAPEDVSALVYASEQRFHGTPSGIDNTVIAYERPIWFVRSNDEGRTTNDESSTPTPSAFDLHPSPESPQAPRNDERRATNDEISASTSSSFVPRPSSLVQGAIEPIEIAAPFTLVVGDTGVRSPTRLPVGEVRRRWRSDAPRYEAIFDAIGALAGRARLALAAGDLAALGALLDANQSLLEELGVSSPELDRLIGAARRAGALGAKLSGAGWGGVMLALADGATQERIAAALADAGAARVLTTTVAAS